VKQLGFPILTSLPEPMMAPEPVVAACATESDAVRLSLRIAKIRYGRTQSEIARLCGWKSDSFLSELKKGGDKLMPDMRVRPFLYATGCRLLEQFRDRQREYSALTGNPTQNDKDHLAASLCLRAWDGEKTERRRHAA